MKLPNSPTQGLRLKVAIGPLFPTANIFSWVGIGFMYETGYEKPNPTNFSANTLLRGARVLRTHEGPKNPYISLFSHTIQAGSD